MLLELRISKVEDFDYAFDEWPLYSFESKVGVVLFLS